MLKNLFRIFSGRKALNQPGLGGETLLTRAIKMRDNDALRETLKAGADPDAKNALGETPLYLALDMKDRAALRQLLKAHATQEKRNGQTFRQNCWDAGLPDIAAEAERIRRAQDAAAIALSWGRGF